MLGTDDKNEYFICRSYLDMYKHVTNAFTTYPKHPHMRSSTVRLETFDTWQYMTDVMDLVDAGLFYPGTHDLTKCFYCGGCIYNWSSTDDPFVEHLRLYGDCKFIQSLQVRNAHLSTYNTGIFDTQDLIFYAANKVSNTDLNSVISKVIAETNMRLSKDDMKLYVNEILNLTEAPKQQDRLCKICTVNETNILVNPCKHAYMCVECSVECASRGLTTCSICCRRIEDVERIYIL